MSLKFLQRSFIAGVVLLLSTAAISLYALESREYTFDEFIPGTRCPKPQSNEYISICGTLRSHDPDESPLADTIPEPNKLSGQPVPNVYVFLYECDPNESTCKVGGKLANPFAWTKTTDNGQFHIQSRKVGGAQVRYLVFACRGASTENAGEATFYIDSVHKFPSYHNIPDLIEYVACETDTSTEYSTGQNQVTITGDDTEIAGPPQQLQFGPDGDVVLACDASDDTTGTLPSTREINSKVEAAVEATFDIRVKGFDQRFTPSKYEGNSGTEEKTPGLLTNYIQGGEHVGGFWSRNCPELLGSEDNEDSHCPNPGDTPDEYERLLYTQGWENQNQPFVLQTHSYGIPPKNKLLAPREITARADYSAYTQDPFRVSQFILGSFGACLETDTNGKALGYRQYGEDKPQQFYNCDSFRRCASAFGRGEDDYRNLLTVTGPGRAASPRFTMYNMYNAYIGGDTEQVVCEKDGQQITFGQIQPWWDRTCEPGQEGCQYVLGPEYFDPYLLMVSIGKAPTTYKTTVFNVPDSSFQPKPIDPARNAAYVIGQDADRLTQASTRSTFPGVFTDVNGKNNTMASSSAALADAVARVGANNFSDNEDADINMSELFAIRFQEPSKDAKTRKLLLSGDFTMTNFGNEMVNYCQNSLQNGEGVVAINSGNETTMRINNLVIKPKEDGTPRQGIDAHYCEGDLCKYGQPIPPEDGAATGVSHVIYSSAALNRSEKIGDLPLLTGYLSRLKVRLFDGAINTSMGTGEVIFDPISLADIIIGLTTSLGEPPTIKAFYDPTIEETPGSPIGRDDFIVRYDKVNSPYGTYEAVSEESFQRFFSFPTESGDFETVYDNSNPYPFPWRSSWGDNYCYAWGNGKGTKDNNPPVEGNGGGQVEEKFGTIIPVAEYCGNGYTDNEERENEVDDRPLTFTKRYSISVPDDKFINGKYDDDYIDPDHFSISNSCRSVQCLLQGGGECGPKYQKAWCAEQQLTTIKESNELKCKYNQGPGASPREGKSYCDNSYLKDGQPSTAYCAYDEKILVESLAANACNPQTEPECCDDAQRKPFSFYNPCTLQTETVQVCATETGNGDFSAEDVQEIVDEWIFCTVQVAGPFGAQGRLKQCDGIAEFSSTVEIIPQTEVEPDSQIDPLESTQIADNLMYRLFRLRFAPTDRVCFDQNDPASCRNVSYRYRSGALNTVSASIIAKQFANDEGVEVTRDTAKQDSEGIGQSFSLKGMFSIPRENWSSRTVLNEPETCTPGSDTYGWDCQIKPLPNPENVDLTQLQKSCSNFHPNEGGCKNLIFAQQNGGPTPPNLSQTFINVMEAAASKFQVPPSLLLASMKVSGGFDEFRHYWTDEAIPELNITNENILIHDPNNDFIGTSPWYTYLPKSYKNGKVYECSNTDGGKHGPFKMWKLYYEREMDRNVLPIYGGWSDETTAFMAIDELSAGRGDVAREIRCNFLHSAYVAAAAIRNEATVWSNNYGVASPANCAASSWSNWDVTEKAVRYLQYPFVLDTEVARDQDLFDPFKEGNLVQNIMNACD
jgi:hypothetical protein